MSPHHKPLIILAGGAGRRIGGQKPEVLLEGRPLIDHITRRLAHQGRLIISGDSQLAARRALPFIADTYAEGGPLAGIHAALVWAKSEGLEAIISLPCDVPFLPLDLVARLGASTDTLTIAGSGARQHPTVGLWPVGIISPLETALRQGHRTMSDFLVQHAHSVVNWPIEPFDPFFNINTPFDLALAEIIAATGASPVALDVEGLKCPLPALKTARTLDHLAQGTTLLVSATDPLAILDIPHLVSQRGDHLLAYVQDKKTIRFLIRRNGA